MSITINIEDFRSWSEIFGEIRRQTNLKTFEAIEPDTTNVYRQERKTRSSSVTEPESIHCHMLEGRASVQETLSHKRSLATPRLLGARLVNTPSRVVDTENIKPRSRLNSTPALKADTYILEQDSRLTDAAKKLSKKQLKLLYEDILKPLDVYSILLGRSMGLKESQ